MIWTASRGPSTAGAGRAVPHLPGLRLYTRAPSRAGEPRAR